MFVEISETWLFNGNDLKDPIKDVVCYNIIV
jgi:hypothetical protein